MQYASFTGVVKIILIILLIYYGLKIITRFFGPLLFKYIVKKAGERFGQQFDQFNQQQQPKSKEGEVSLDKQSHTTSSSKKTVGEYIDFEEID
ncbi:DUF4834 family protein [Aquimarina rhabdastrellae]